VDAPDPEFATPTAKTVRAARLFLPESKCGGTGITYPSCMFIPLFPAQTCAGLESHLNNIPPQPASYPVMSTWNTLYMWCGADLQLPGQYRGKTRKFAANPGTIFVLPQGTVDDSIWNGPVLRIAASIRPDLLLNALEETAAARSIELIEQWNLTDRISCLCCLR